MRPCATDEARAKRMSLPKSAAEIRRGVLRRRVHRTFYSSVSAAHSVRNELSSLAYWTCSSEPAAAAMSEEVLSAGAESTRKAVKHAIHVAPQDGSSNLNNQKVTALCRPATGEKQQESEKSQGIAADAVVAPARRTSFLPNSAVIEPVPSTLSLRKLDETRCPCADCLQRHNFMVICRSLSRRSPVLCQPEPIGPRDKAGSSM